MTAKNLFGGPLRPTEQPFESLGFSDQSRGDQWRRQEEQRLQRVLANPSLARLGRQLAHTYHALVVDLDGTFNARWAGGRLAELLGAGLAFGIATGRRPDAVQDAFADVKSLLLTHLSSQSVPADHELLERTLKCCVVGCAHGAYVYRPKYKEVERSAAEARRVPLGKLLDRRGRLGLDALFRLYSRLADGEQAIVESDSSWGFKRWVAFEAEAAGWLQRSAPELLKSWLAGQERLCFRTADGLLLRSTVEVLFDAPLPQEAGEQRIGSLLHSAGIHDFELRRSSHKLSVKLPFKSRIDEDHAAEVIAAACRVEGVPLRAFAHDLGIDLVSAKAGKLRVVECLQSLLEGEGCPVALSEIARVGDQGQRAGNDHELLNSFGGFSVGEAADDVTPLLVGGRPARGARGTEWLLEQLHFTAPVHALTISK